MALPVSHPTRVRGLKPDLKRFRVPSRGSHPTRVRGLKRATCARYVRRGWSHPTRVRGLKPFVRHWLKDYFTVAPHAGAWIETASSPAPDPGNPRRTPRGCVD